MDLQKVADAKVDFCVLRFAFCVLRFASRDVDSAMMLCAEYGVRIGGGVESHRRGRMMCGKAVHFWERSDFVRYADRRLGLLMMMYIATMA
jgi:hypothetical protein